MAGLATLIAARLVADLGWPFELGAARGRRRPPSRSASSSPVPALRTRGVNLAVVTLGLAVVVNA